MNLKGVQKLLYYPGNVPCNKQRKALNTATKVQPKKHKPRLNDLIMTRGTECPTEH